MDKHDRPYRCTHPQCAKLLGFTYSGGLLRHEREVHNKHGGPKESLACPYPNCKRNKGKGFTRKENLNEHTRRVHNNQPLPGDEERRARDEEAFKHMQAIAGASNAALSTSMSFPPSDPVAEQFQPDTAEMVNKRPRLDGDDVPTDGIEELRLENGRLRAENAEKDALIREMETREAQREERIAYLEEMIGMRDASTQQPQNEPDEKDVSGQV
jgi:hypothetical protein